MTRDEIQDLSGRQLDEAVARLREEFIVDAAPVGSGLDEYVFWLQRDGDYGLEPWAGPLPYHDDDRLAAELRREIPRVVLIRGRIPERPDVVECWSTWDGDDGRLHATPRMEGDTEAEATARAWLMWKEVG